MISIKLLWGLAMWPCGLWMPVQVLATPLLTQFPVNVTKKAKQEGPSVSVPSNMGDLEEAPDFWLTTGLLLVVEVIWKIEPKLFF